MIKVTVWNENLHEQRQEEVRQIYPQGIHGCIADFLGADRNLFVRTATLAEPEHGLTEEVLSDTDVLIYWGHRAHHAFSDEVAERVQRHVLQGMGLIALHSAHLAKIMIRLLGTSMTLRWRHGDRERLCENGIRAGHAAGCVTVMIPDLMAPSPEIVPYCSHIFLDLLQASKQLGV